MEQTVEEKLKALYELQTIHTKIDRIRQVRGELPMEVADLEDDVAGLETRIQKIKAELDDLEDDIVTRKNLIKVDSTGTVISHSESLDNIYSNFLLISDGGIITGYNIVTNGGDIGFSKIRDDGNIEWTKTFGGTGDESLNYIFELNSGGYYLIGTTTNLTGKWKKYLMYKTDFPYKQYYEYDKESVSSYYFIKTDNTGNISNQ